MNDLPQSRRLAPSERLNVAIEFTNYCNYACQTCPVSHRKAGTPQPTGEPYDRPLGFISDEVFARALAECHQVAACVTLGFFGEQLMHPRFSDYLAAMRGAPFQIHLFTNVSRVTRRHFEDWVAAGLTTVRLSLDAVTPALYDRLRPGPVLDLNGARPGDPGWGAGLSRMEIINAKVRAWLARPDHCPTHLIFVKSGFLPDDQEQQRFVATWQPLLGPLDKILCKPVNSYGGKIRDPRITPGRCNVWDVRYLTIDWRGEVSPCNLDTNMDLRLGSIMTDALETLYYGEQAARLRPQTGCGREITPCRSCLDANNWSEMDYYTAGGGHQRLCRSEVLPTPRPPGPMST